MTITGPQTAGEEAAGPRAPASDPTPPTPAPQATGRTACANCGAALADDQEWCVECGAGRTVIRRAPDWRIPLAIIMVVVLLVLAVFAIALINLSSAAG